MSGSWKMSRTLGALILVVVVLVLVFHRGHFSLEIRDVWRGMNRGVWIILFIYLSWICWDMAFVDVSQKRWWKKCRGLKHVTLNEQEEPVDLDAQSTGSSRS